MIIIGENIHVIAKAVSTAIRERDAKVIQDLAKARAGAGADYIDLNVGFLRKDPEETMQWVVNTVQQVTDLPLSLDTMNPIAMEAGLKICQKGLCLIRHQERLTQGNKCFPWPRNITVL